jgi:hypothetical protein
MIWKKYVRQSRIPPYICGSGSIGAAVAGLNDKATSDRRKVESSIK